MGLQNKWFDAIVDGYKVFELRLFDEKRRKIKPGDVIIFTSKDGRELVCRVRGLVLSDTFKNLFEIIPYFKAACPNVKSQEEMLSIMEQFYPLEKQKKVGVVAINLSLED